MKCKIKHSPLSVKDFYWGMVFVPLKSMKTLMLTLSPLLFLIACGTGKPPVINNQAGVQPQPPVRGKAYTMVTYRGLAGSKDSFPVNMPQIIFRDDSTLGGNTGCNAFFGKYSKSGVDGISLQIIGMTKMFCMGVDETGFIEAAQSADRYELKDKELRLFKGTAEVMFLRESPVQE